MLLIISVVAFIFSAVLPHIVTKAMHNAVLELALEVAAIGPLEATLSAHLIGQPVSSVLTAIGPEVAAFTFFDSMVKITMIVAAITPNLNPHAVLSLLEACQV